MEEFLRCIAEKFQIFVKIHIPSSPTILREERFSCTKSPLKSSRLRRPPMWFKVSIELLWRCKSDFECRNLLGSPFSPLSSFVSFSRKTMSAAFRFLLWREPAFLPTKKRKTLCGTTRRTTRVGVVFKRRKNSHMGKAWKHDEFCTCSSS